MAEIANTSLPPLALIPWAYWLPLDDDEYDDETPAFRQVEAPPCGHTIGVPTEIQGVGGMPALLACDLLPGHEGNHMRVWDPVIGNAIGWHRDPGEDW